MMCRTRADGEGCYNGERRGGIAQSANSMAPQPAVTLLRPKNYRARVRRGSRCVDSA